MRICLFSYAFFPRIGGLEQVGENLAASWTGQGHTVVVVTATPPPPGQADYDRRFPFPVIRLPAGRAGKRHWRSILAEYDLIVSNGVSLTYWLRWVRSRRPIVFIHQLFLGIRPYEHVAPWRVQQQRRLRLLVRRFVLRRAAGNVFISRFIQREVGVSNGVVIYNPIDSQFRPLPDTAGASDFSFFGRMVAEKGVACLLDALALCRSKGHSFSVDLYGEGKELDEFKRKSAELNLDSQVRWLPFLRGEELVRAMNAAKSVLVPSLWNEPLGIVALEAMACGKCVIASAGGGLGEVVEGRGLTFPNGNAQKLAEQMISAMTDPDLRQRCEEAALAKSRDFALENIAAEYINYFKNL